MGAETGVDWIGCWLLAAGCSRQAAEWREGVEGARRQRHVIGT